MIPDWVVQLRHETTHGHMSSLETLKLGLDFALQWVIKNYWEPELASARKFLMAGGMMHINTFLCI